MQSSLKTFWLANFSVDINDAAG